jgi:phage head maturation protease
MKAGACKGLSIGYRTIKDLMDGPVRRLKELALYEGSVVTLACNPLAQITAVKRQGEQDLEVLQAFRNAAKDINDFHRRMIDGN